MACYHAQQCAEKYLKRLPDCPFCTLSLRTRSLIYLMQLCIAHDPTFEKLMPAIEILNEYGATMRYPMEGSVEPDIETAREAIRLAEQIATLVRKRLDDERV